MKRKRAAEKLERLTLATCHSQEVPAVPSGFTQVSLHTPSLHVALAISTCLANAGEGIWSWICVSNLHALHVHIVHIQVEGLVVHSRLTFSSALRLGEAKAAARPVSFALTRLWRSRPAKLSPISADVFCDTVRCLSCQAC